MSENKPKEAVQQTVLLENRARLAVTGVREVRSFDEVSVSAATDLGEFLVRGAELRVTGFTVETGDLTVEGKIDAFGYRTDRRAGGLFGRLLR